MLILEISPQMGNGDSNDARKIRFVKFTLLLQSNYEDNVDWSEGVRFFGVLVGLRLFYLLMWFQLKSCQTL
jgi:hypothetical protein